jgi:hypothetical protein
MSQKHFNKSCGKILMENKANPAPQQAAQQAELVSNAEDRKSTAVTIYNGNFALVKEQRKLILPSGQVELRLREVSAQMQPETASLTALSGEPVVLYEQNFDFDLLSPDKLLQKYVGRDITVIRTHPTTGEDRRESATVLATNDGVVLRFADRIETGVPGRLAFDSVPANLRDVPTLSVVIEAAGGEQLLELSYLTGGMSWRADYVANLNADGSSLTLSGWVTLTNRSGTTFADTTLQLVAGTVNRAREPDMYGERTRGLSMAAPAGAAPREEQLLDFHLYTYERKTTLADNQVKQLALLSTGPVPVRREYLLMGSSASYTGRASGAARKYKPATYVEFDNKGEDLNKPLPAGIVRVYTKDRAGGAQFVGEDRIEHTAKGEIIKLKLGEAFDVTVERKQTDCTTIGERGAQTSHHVEIRNAKDTPVTVRLEEPIPGEWHVVRASAPHVKDSSNTASWLVDVPANGATVLEYTIRTKW